MSDGTQALTVALIQTRVLQSTEPRRILNPPLMLISATASLSYLKALGLPKPHLLNNTAPSRSHSGRLAYSPLRLRSGWLHRSRVCNPGAWRIRNGTA